MSLPPDPAPPPGSPGDEGDVSFGGLNDYLGYKLRQAQAASFRHLDRLGGKWALSPGRFSLLTVIGANPGVTATEIARAFGLDKSTLSPVLDLMVKARLVGRSRSKLDGRAYALFLTAAGRRVVAERRAQIEAQEALMSGCLNAAEREQMMALLDRLIAALDAAGN